jgi:hypothetical protein
VSEAPKATALAFERRYADGSGVEYAVRLKGDKIELESVDDVSFPVAELDWLIACLQRIKDEVGGGIDR